MSVAKWIAAGLVLAGIEGVNIGLGLAEDAPQPTSSTESYETWTMECSNIVMPDPAAKPGAAPAAKRVCEVAQVYRNQKTGNEVARIAFGLDDKDKTKIVGGLRTLVDVSFDKPIQVLDGDKEISKSAFKRCVGPFCYGFFDTSEANLTALGKAAAPVLQFPISNGQLLRIRISPKGLDSALKALKSHGQ